MRLSGLASLKIKSQRILRLSLRLSQVRSFITVQRVPFLSFVTVGCTVWSGVVYRAEYTASQSILWPQLWSSVMWRHQPPSGPPGTPGGTWRCPGPAWPGLVWEGWSGCLISNTRPVCPVQPSWSHGLWRRQSPASWRTVLPYHHHHHHLLLQYTSRTSSWTDWGITSVSSGVAVWLLQQFSSHTD